MERPDVMDDDEMEELLAKVVDNADVIKSLMGALDKLKSAGIIDLMTGLVNDYVPTDVDFLGKFFSSKEFTVSMMKSMNVLISVMGAMASEKNSDMIKGLMFNMENITDNVNDAVENPRKYSPLKLRNLIGDEDIMLSLSVMMALMKGMGQIMRRIGPQK